MSIGNIISDFFGVNKFALIAVVVASAAGGYLGWHERALREPAILIAQEQVDAKACTTAQATTKEQNDELTKDRDRIAGDAARYKRLHPDACYNFARDGQLQPGGEQHADVHGISTDWLRDYAALCETYRSELMVCTGQHDTNAK